MAGARRQSKPTFLWQGVLILGPMLLLLGVGVWTLWRDREGMEREVRTRMDPLAISVNAEFQSRLQPITARRVGDAVSLGVSGTWFELRSDNSLEQPHLLTWPPTPAPFPTNLIDCLKPEPAEHWSRAVSAEKNAGWREAVGEYSAFASFKEIRNRNSPGADGSWSDERLRGEAYNRMAAIYLKAGETNLAVQAFDAVLRSFSPGSDTRSEAGLPMPHLAALRIFELTPVSADLPHSWKTNTAQLLALLSHDYSPFGRELALRFQHWLEPSATDLALPEDMKSQPEALQRSWRESKEATFNIAERSEVEWWLDSQESWRLYHEAAAFFDNKDFIWPKLFWMDGDYPWLAVEQKIPKAAGRGRIFAAIAKKEIQDELSRIAVREDPLGLFAISLSLNGRQFAIRETDRTIWRNRAISRFIDVPEDSLSVTVALSDPAKYFNAQRRRQFWLCSLMLAAAGASALAFVSAWSAFQKQVLLNDQKSNFVSSVSHELRAPIASVRLMAESLERGKIAGQQKQNEYFRFIVQECRRLSSLIENVLDFSRIEQGRKQYEFEPTDLLALTRETVKLMEPYAAEKGVELRFETFNNEHLCRAEVREGGLTFNAQATPNSKLETLNFELTVDGRAIQQALINLIDNAVKHSAKGQMVQVAVSGAACQASDPAVRVEPLTPDTPHLKLSVTDNGPGIPSAEHEKIFERFYRLGSELRRETQGVGIGLSIVKHIVEAHGGRVCVESEVGKGSRFTVELPVSHRDTEAPR